MNVPRMGSQYIRYSVFGFLCMMFDLFTLGLFLAIGVWYPIAVAVSYWLASSLHYLSNRRWTFTESLEPFWEAYWHYLTVNIFSIALLTLLVTLVVELFSIEVMAARVGCAVIVGTLAFYLQRRFSFKVTS